MVKLKVTVTRHEIKINGTVLPTFVLEAVEYDIFYSIPASIAIPFNN